jgi:hypothetical protein
MTFFLVRLGFELRVLDPPIHFALIILEIGSHKLFAQAGFEL